MKKYPPLLDIQKRAAAAADEVLNTHQSNCVFCVQGETCDNRRLIYLTCRAILDEVFREAE